MKIFRPPCVAASLVMSTGALVLCSAASSAPSPGIALAAQEAAAAAGPGRAQPEPPGPLRGEARRHVVGHLGDVPEGPVVLAGDLVRQPAGREPTPYLSRRRADPGLRRRQAPGAGASAAARRRGGTEKLSPRVRESGLQGRHPRDPLEVIGAFLGRGSILQKDEYEKAPYVVAIREEHMVAAQPATTSTCAARLPGVGHGYSVVHVGDKLRRSGRRRRARLRGHLRRRRHHAPRRRSRPRCS